MAKFTEWQARTDTLKALCEDVGGCQVVFDTDLDGFVTAATTFWSTADNLTEEFRRIGAFIAHGWVLAAEPYRPWGGATTHCRWEFGA